METDLLSSRLVRVLQRDGRATITDVAGELGVSRSKVDKALSALIDSQQVRFTAVIAPNASEPSIRAHVSIWAVGRTAPVVDLLKAHPAVRFLSTIAGLNTVVAECVADDTRALQALLTQIRSAPGVEAVNTLIFDYVHVFASLPVAPGPTAVALDPTDRQLLAILDADGRATYRTMGAAVNLSASSAMKRVHRMMETGLVRISAVPRRDQMAGTQTVTMGVGLNVRGNPDHTAAALVGLSSLEFAATTVGRYDLLLTISSSSLAELHGQLDEIHTRAEVSSLETWVHLEILREEYGLPPRG